jgi:hypothetical protein
MRIRADLAFVSSVLFTISLLNLIPAGRWYFSSPADTVTLARLDAGFRAQLQTWHYLGIASLAIILIGLIVTWTGYVKRSRSAWCVMFVVTWAWAFPLFAWPYLKGPRVLTLPEWIFNAIYEPGSPRTAAQLVVTVSLMVMALLLPLKSFFLARGAPTPTRALSLRFVCRSAITVFLVVITLFISIHAQVYELTPEQLNYWQQLPPPPPPAPREAQRLTEGH